MKCIVCEKENASYRCRKCWSAYCSSACFKKHRMSKEEAAAARAQNTATGAQDAAPNSDNDDYLCETIMATLSEDVGQEMELRRTKAEADVFSDLSRKKATTTSQRGRLKEASPAATTPAACSNSTAPQALDSATAQPSESASAVPSEQKTSGEMLSGGLQHQEGGSTSAPADVADDGEHGEEVAADADAVYILQEKHLSALANDATVRSALRSPSLQKLIRTIDASRSRLDALDAAQYNNADFKRFCSEVMRAIAKAEGR